MQLDDVFVVEDVGVMDVLAGIGVVAPDFCKFEFFGQPFVDDAGQVGNGRAGRYYERLFFVDRFSGRLGINAYDIQ